jgi:hypothetical protein
LGNRTFLPQFSSAANQNQCEERISFFGNLSLTPGFSPVSYATDEAEPFQRLGGKNTLAGATKRLKPFLLSLASLHPAEAGCY